MLTKDIYYADKDILDQISVDFDFIEKREWFHLYQHRTDRSYWRLDEWDKYNQQCFVRLSTIENWESFDDKELRIALLKSTIGVSDKACIWLNCTRSALHGIVYCEKHAYEEMGLRR